MTGRMLRFVAQPTVRGMGRVALGAICALSGASCDGHGHAGGEPDPDGGTAPYALFAVQPATARAGDTVTLEGTFGDTVVVQFPGGASASASVLGPHRASVVVP